MKFFTQDVMFEVSREKMKPPKQILLPYAVRPIMLNLSKCLIATASGSPVPSFEKSTHIGGGVGAAGGAEDP